MCVLILLSRTRSYLTYFHIITGGSSRCPRASYQVELCCRLFQKMCISYDLFIWIPNQLHALVHTSYWLSIGSIAAGPPQRLLWSGHRWLHLVPWPVPRGPDVPCERAEQQLDGLLVAATHHHSSSITNGVPSSMRLARRRIESNSSIFSTCTTTTTTTPLYLSLSHWHRSKTEDRI